MMDLKILRLNYNPPNVLELGYGEIFRSMDEVIILTSLMQTFDRFMLVCEVTWKHEPDMENVKELKLVESAEEISRDGMRSLMMVSGVFPDPYKQIIREFFDTFNCFIEFPARFTMDTMTGSIVGTQENINLFLEFASTWGARYQILSIQKYEPRVETLLAGLTPKQYSCLEAAVREGFFDIPRKADSRELASKLGIAHTTLLEHIKKGERSILRKLFRV
ncbi:MAG: helix-turn-helix domain-containing protein [Candidatus Thermoplasmatota archaeon]|nr:helix-turn-helix domain-containing protein [Candidatus Thermoplasmatota archaeon]